MNISVKTTTQSRFIFAIFGRKWVILLKTRNISKQYGGVDTKLKHKILSTVKILIICMAGVAICVGLYHLVDDGLNGTVVDWFEKNYMLTTE